MVSIIELTMLLLLHAVFPLAGTAEYWYCSPVVLPGTLTHPFVVSCEHVCQYVES